MNPVPYRIPEWIMNRARSGYHPELRGLLRINESSKKGDRCWAAISLLIIAISLSVLALSISSYAGYNIIKIKRTLLPIPLVTSSILLLAGIKVAYHALRNLKNERYYNSEKGMKQFYASCEQLEKILKTEEELLRQKYERLNRSIGNLKLEFDSSKEAPEDPRMKQLYTEEQKNFARHLRELETRRESIKQELQELRDFLNDPKNMPPISLLQKFEDEVACLD